MIHGKNQELECRRFSQLATFVLYSQNPYVHISIYLIIYVYIYRDENINIVGFDIFYIFKIRNKSTKNKNINNFNHHHQFLFFGGIKLRKWTDKINDSSQWYVPIK